MSTPDEQNLRRQRVFAQALALGGAERRAYLEAACAGDAALRTEIEALLAAHEQAGSFMTLQEAGTTLAEKAGDRIGRYKLLEKIGEGGFGVVWMAEQEEPVRRRVALKIIKPGMDTREVVARFEAERQALALMDHPNIATVFDGGATQAGRPYFVMELVRGVPITEYCDVNLLPPAERLKLCVQVCQAVQHAHQKGVIHRDLKPSNILVTVRDDRPVPKVIDFGVAKATQARLTEKTLFTRFHQWIGTPAYMSPEQAGLGSLDVDTRSDVYSLGVLLYELLTGQTPFDTEKLLAQGYDAIMRTIREEEPPKPSTRLSTLAQEELNAVAAKRGAEAAKLSRWVRGDLDWIVMKALEKDRMRRYDTAVSLGLDIERFLQAEPVSAAAPSLVYRTRKFVRRNRARLVTAALVLVAIALAGVGGSLAVKNRAAQRLLQSSGTNAVFAAASAGDVRLLRRLLDADPRLVGCQALDGATPLASAAWAGSTNTLRLLLERGAAVDATNELGRTALLEAASRDQAPAIALLLEAGANPNQTDHQGLTALLQASFQGSTEAAQLLLARGAKVDPVLQPSGTRPLLHAALMGYADLVEVLLKHGAQPDLKDAYGSTPLNAAAAGRAPADVFRLFNGHLEEFAARDSVEPTLRVATAFVSTLLAQRQGQVPVNVRSGGQHRRAGELLIARKADVQSRDRAGATPLHTAAGTGNAEMASLLLDAGANPNATDTAGFTPLNTAVEHGHLAVVELLLARNAKPNLACPDGHAPMHSAAWRGNVALLLLLLERGADLHPLTRSGTPLDWAVQSRKRHAVEFLLSRGAKAAMGSPESGMTALHWAAAVGDPVIVEGLLKSGANPDGVDPCWQGTPLNLAAAGRKAIEAWLAGASARMPAGAKPFPISPGTNEEYLAVLRQLLVATTNINAREPRFQRTPLFAAVTTGHASALELLLKAGADVQAVDTKGLTALHAASEMDAPPEVMSNIVVSLLRAGVSPEARDHNLATPLHAAANSGKVVMAALLLEAGARVNAAGPNLCTPLQLAVMRGRLNVARLLLAKNPDLEWRNKVGTTAFHCAVQIQSRDLATLLLQHGANVNARTAGSEPGSTALMIAAGDGDLGMVELLFEHGAEINAASDDGWTALMVAASKGRLEAARRLLDQGAKFDVGHPGKSTPAMMAAKFGQLDVLKFLLEREASLSDANEFGFTAFHEAVDRGHPQVVEFLLERGEDANLLTGYGTTPLHCAAHAAFTNFTTTETHYVAVAKLLLDHGAKLEARTPQQQTPLHRAAVWGRSLMIQFLLAAGADAEARDENGRLALDLAIAGRHTNCVELLRAAGPARAREKTNTN